MILEYARNGNKSDVMMDSLTYHYVAGSNRLDFVSDSIAASRYGGAGEIQDIDNQNASNYGYDAIGNLVRDDAEGIMNIRWNVYGKIAEIDKTASVNQPIVKINYTYDAQGNRIGSITEQNDGTRKYTWYVRDAQGNVMTVYNTQGTSSDLSTLGLQATERHIYGSSALGMDNSVVNVSNGAASTTDSNSIKYWRGTRQYSLGNHLGNVLATVGDRKIGHDINSDGVIDYYDADVRTAQDYYAFGMTMPGRNFTAADAAAYRYGFNGKENDNDVKGLGNQQDYGLRVYDTRLGKFLSIDPLTKKYPELTPYQFASNSPIENIDLDGAEKLSYMDRLPANTVAEGVGNSLYNVIGTAYNGIAGTWNGAVDLVSNSANSGLANGVMMTAQEGYENSIKPVIDYVTKTPGSQQLSDVKKDFRNPDTYFKAFEQGVVAGAFWKIGGGGKPATALSSATATEVTASANTNAASSLLGGNFDAFVSTASKMDRNGLTQAGRALQKHAGREGTSFADIKFSGKTGNKQALGIVNDILASKNQIIKASENGTQSIFDKATGRGVNVSRTGSFNGFRDLKEQKK